jgi:hypothetical protein
MQIGSERSGFGERAARRLRLRYPGTCEACGAELAPGTDALYDPTRKTIRCLSCPAPTEAPVDPPVDLGIAGGSARREFERRAAKREAETKARYGVRLGGVIVALTNEPQSTRAWATGAHGEELLGATLAGVPGIVVLNDRRVPGTKTNIDHVVIGPAGVFVIDAKRYAGRIGIHNKGGLFRSDYRLYVGRRDCSALADGVAWQADAVVEALRATGVDALPPATPVLCFVEGDWPLINPPSSFQGVRLESERSLKRLVTQGLTIDPRAIEWATRVLATALPAK